MLSDSRGWVFSSFAQHLLLLTDLTVLQELQQGDPYLLPCWFEILFGILLNFPFREFLNNLESTVNYEQSFFFFPSGHRWGKKMLQNQPTRHSLWEPRTVHKTTRELSPDIINQQDAWGQARKTFRQRETSNKVTSSCAVLLSGSPANLLLEMGWFRGEDELTTTMKVRNKPSSSAAGCLRNLLLSLLVAILWCKSGNQREWEGKWFSPSARK